MKKQLLIGIVVAAVVVVGIVVAKKISTDAKSRSIRVEEKNKAAALKKLAVVKIGEATRYLEAKNYDMAIAVCRDILTNVDTTSQQAKNILQMARVAQLEKMRVEGPSMPGVPPAGEEAAAAVVN